MKNILIFIAGALSGMAFCCMVYDYVKATDMEATEGTVVETVSEPVAETVVEPEPIVEPAAKPAAKPVVKRTAKPVAKSAAKPATIKGLTLFPEPQEWTGSKRFEVYKVLDNGNALAEEQRLIARDMYFTDGIKVLFLCEKGSYYYDEQILKAPVGKRIMQVGIYKYTYGYHDEKTVPAVVIVSR